MGIKEASEYRMVRIYIRHSDKEYMNGNSEMYKHDPGLTQKGIDNAVEFGRILVETVGLPTHIVTSPYRRCRQTSEVLCSTFPPDHDVKILCDARLSEYLGNHPMEPLDVTEETLAFNPPHPESLREFDQRVLEHYQDMIPLDSMKESVWFVTHGIVVSRIARYACGFNNLKLPPLGAIHLVKTIQGLAVHRINWKASVEKSTVLCI